MSTSSDNKRERKFRGKKSRAHRTRLLATAVVILLVVSLVTVYVLKPGTQSTIDSDRVLLLTSMGNITIQLYDDMPITTGNFKNLISQGVYDGTIFHRVVQNFVVQGGDASTKGIVVPSIADELPNKHNNVRGSVAMAKTNQSNSATSQFFINVKDNSADLDSNYSVFGTVISGMEVVDTIRNVSVDSDDRPLEDVTILVAVLVE